VNLWLFGEASGKDKNSSGEEMKLRMKWESESAEGFYGHSHNNHFQIFSVENSKKL